MIHLPDSQSKLDVTLKQFSAKLGVRYWALAATVMPLLGCLYEGHYDNHKGYRMTALSHRCHWLQLAPDCESGTIDTCLLGCLFEEHYDKH